MLKSFMAMMIAVGVLSASAATAATETFEFSGNCSSCDNQGLVTARLVLQDYVYGEQINYSNFIFFHYDGSKYVSAFSLLPSPQMSISGQINADRSARLSLDDLSKSAFVASSGFWAFGPNDDVNDFGSNARFEKRPAVSAAPEPAAWALMVIGVSITGLAIRRRRSSIKYFI